jgi:hypothetical protein
MSRSPASVGGRAAVTTRCGRSGARRPWVPVERHRPGRRRSSRDGTHDVRGRRLHGRQGVRAGEQRGASGMGGGAGLRMGHATDIDDQIEGTGAQACRGCVLGDVRSGRPTTGDRSQDVAGRRSQHRPQDARGDPAGAAELPIDADDCILGREGQRLDVLGHPIGQLVQGVDVLDGVAGIKGRLRRGDGCLRAGRSKNAGDSGVE